MVHADERQARGEREAAPVVRANEEAAHQTRSDRRGDRIDRAQLDARIVQRLLRDAVERVQMLARRDLRNDAAGVYMHELRRDDVGHDPPAVVDDGDARLVARRLDREDAQGQSSSSCARSFATRSRTARSRRRSVHMMIASSLLSL